jgi:hypothetical protein
VHRECYYYALVFLIVANMNKIREILSAGIIAGASVLGVTGCKGEESVAEKCARVPHSVHDIDGICREVRSCCGIVTDEEFYPSYDCLSSGSFCSDLVMDCARTQELFKDGKDCGIIPPNEVVRLCNRIIDKCVYDNDTGRDSWYNRGTTGSHDDTCVELAQKCGKVEGKTAAK